MRKFLIVVFMLGLSGCQQPEFYSVQGGEHRFDDFKGRYLVVNYWATWCAPCIREIPELNAFADEFHDRVAVWGVNFDAPEGAEQLRQVQKMHHISRVCFESKRAVGRRHARGAADNLGLRPAGSIARYPGWTSDPRVTAGGLSVEVVFELAC